MLAVCNTTPLNYLVQLDLADLLPVQFGEIVIPDAVLAELSADRTPTAVREWIQNPPNWLRVDTVAIPEHPDFDEIHAGEVAAICLAEKLTADITILDDAQARIIAARRGLRLAGTLGVLRDAALTGAVANLPQTLTRLRALGFYIAPTLYEQLIGAR